MKQWLKNKKLKRGLPSFLIAGLSRLNGRLIAISNFLQQKTNHYSLRKKKILLLLFVIMFLTESSVVLVQSVTRKSKTAIVVTRIKPIPVDSRKITISLIPKSEFLKIQRFKNFVDSLSTTGKGKIIKDSLLHNRPQLMDSVNCLINLYLEQSKTKMK